MTLGFGFLRAALAVSASLALLGAAPSATASGTLERVIVHGVSLEGALEGDSADREVFVYLPPGYGSAPARRYPVIYSLHGYAMTARLWTQMLDAPAAFDRAVAAGAPEMIVVMPDAMTLHGGSFYSNSVTTGNWEDFIAEDLVAWVDAHYRTLASPSGRGLMGHSMGGYGALRIAMKKPGVFDSIYAMSPCCLRPRGAGAEFLAPLESVATQDQARALSRDYRNELAAAAAWAPDPQRPPLFLDLPTRGGQANPVTLARFAANAPHIMLPHYLDALRSYDAVAFDVGRQDDLLEDGVVMDQLMAIFAVPHTFETYEGDHVNRIRERFGSNVLPFFAAHLDSAADASR